MATEPNGIADPERALAVAYAPRDKQAGLATLFELDERLGQVLATTSEPMIGLMRLAWWREALEKLDRDRAPAEPVLQALVTHVMPHGVTGAALSNIEDGWAALIDDAAADSVIVRHGRERGRNLFAAAASILGAKDERLALAGEIWALADLGFRHSQASLRDAALTRARALALTMPAGRWAPAARPLAALFLLAVRDSRSGRRVQGSPGRLLRMLALRLTGH